MIFFEWNRGNKTLFWKGSVYLCYFCQFSVEKEAPKTTSMQFLNIKSVLRVQTEKELELF